MLPFVLLFFIIEEVIVKSLAKDKAYGIGTNGEIFDVTFGLYAAEELKAADGTVIPEGGLLEVIFLDESGHGKAISDLPIGSYYVQEISTNSAYILDDTKYPVVFEYAGQDTAIVHISANDGNALRMKSFTAQSAERNPMRTETLWAVRKSASLRLARLNLPRKQRLRLPYPQRTVVFLLRKYRMAHGLSVKSKAQKALYSPRKKSP